MKKQFIYLVSAALATGLAACSNDELEGSYSDSAVESYDFAAVIEQPDAPVGTRVAFDKDTRKFSWEVADIIGIFNNSSSDKNAYKYGFNKVKTETTTVAERAAAGKFNRLPSSSSDEKYDTRSDNETETYPTDGITDPLYAFYPYSILHETTNDRTAVSHGTFYVNLDGVSVKTSDSEVNTYAYAFNGDEETDEKIPVFTGESLKMPMAGDYTTSTKKIKFTNLTSLWQFTVKNIPYGYSVAVLESNGEKNIAGKAKVDVINKTLSVLDGEDGVKAIAYDFSDDAPETENDVTTLTFFFVVPAGDYPNGLTFYLDKDATTRESAYAETKLELFSVNIEAKQNVLYRKTLTINGDGEGLESEEISRVNTSLAANAKSETVDMTKVTEENGVIILPKTLATNNNQTITLTLKGNSTENKKITIMEDPAVKDENKAVAKNIIILGDSNSQAPELDIQLPNSTVTLGSDAEGAAATSFSTVTSATSAEGLVVEKNVTITTALAIKAGNAFVKNGATITTSSSIKRDDSNEDDVTYLIYQTKDDITGKYTSANELKVVPEFIHQILTAKTKITEAIVATESIDELGKLDVQAGAEITIDLNGKSLTGSTSAQGAILNLASGATVTIINQSDGTAGTIESKTDDYAAIAVPAGSKATVNNGTIKNAAKGPAVSVGADNAESAGTFILNGGTITGTAAKDGIVAKTYANVQLTSGTISAGDVTLDGKNVTATIKVTLPEKLFVKSGANVTVSNKVEDAEDTELTLTGNITVNASKLAITATEVKGALVAQAGSEVTLNEGKVSYAVGLTGTNTTFIMNGGEIAYDNADNADITAATGTIVNINGGAIANAKGNAISVTGGTLTITDGTITSEAKNAVNITSGKLTVSGNGTPALKGQNVISAVPDTDATVEVNLTAAGATYTSAQEGYTVYNHNDNNDAAPAIKSITGGTFTGDIISDGSKYFIKGDAKFKSCATLEKNKDTYFDTFYTLGEQDAEHYWHVYFHGAPIE
jgi:hypothetical protein